MSSESPLQINKLVEARNIDKMKKCMCLLSSVMETVNRLLDFAKSDERRQKDFSDITDVYEKLYKVYTDYEDKLSASILPDHFW